MSEESERHDPLSSIYYRSLAYAERVVDFAFYVAGFLSIVVLFVSREDNAFAYDAVHSVFVASVVIVFFGGLVVKLYWASRASAGRVSDFFSNAFNVKLSDTLSHGYYNSSSQIPFARLASAVLENTLFTKEISRSMLRQERIKLAAYTLIWFFCLLNRTTDLALIATAAQVLFGEQLISKWLRLEWLRIKCENIHSGLFSILKLSNDFVSPQLQAKILEQVVLYETAKAQAGVSISTRVFRNKNKQLSERWRDIEASVFR